MVEPLTSSSFGSAILQPSLIAGLAGATISLRFVANLSLWERLTAVAGGATMAQFLSPLVSYELNIVAFEQAIGFFIGLFGLSLTAAIYETIKKADIWGFIVAKWGNGGNK